FYEQSFLPAPDSFDLLIIMGGPMSVNDEERHPWLRMEKRFIRQVINLGTPVLGICLGAQLIASCKGEAVYPNRRKEIGWFPVQGITHREETIFSFPSQFEVFHWHGETFDLPSAAILLASSEACINQAFQLGPSVIGLQFHLEVTPASVKAIISNCDGEILPSKFVQRPSVMLDTGPRKFQAANELMGEVLSFLTTGCRT
ncbi:MAG: type 1 glutamine amidotransferase, partial [Desulforhopalus sp.]